MPHVKNRREPREVFLLALACAVLVFAVGADFSLVDAGLPHFLIDENDVVEPAVGVLAGQADQGVGAYEPLYSFLLASIYRVDASWSGQSIADYAIRVFFDPQRFYVLARALNIVIHIALAVVSFFLGRVVFGPRVALLALPLLLFPFADFLTDFTPRVDSLLALFAAVTLLAAIKAYDTDRLGWYLLTGVAFGLSLATKLMPALLMAPTLALTLVLIQVRRQRLSAEPGAEFKGKLGKLARGVVFSRETWAATAVGVGAWVIANPFLFLNLREYWWQISSRIAGEPFREFPKGYDLSRYFPDFGEFFVGGCVLGAVYVLGYVLVRRDARAAILWSYPAVFFLAFAFGSAREYWFVPVMYLSVLFLAKIVADIGAAIPGDRRVGRWVEAVAVIALLSVPAWNLAELVGAGDAGAAAYPALTSRRWIESNIPAGSKVLAFGYPSYFARIIDGRAQDQFKFGEYVFQRDPGMIRLFEQAHQAYLESGRPTYLVTHVGSKCINTAEVRNLLKAERFDWYVTHCDPTGLVSGDGPAMVFPRPNRRFSHPVWIIRAPRPVEPSP